MNPTTKYHKALQHHLATGRATEHTYRPALATLIEELGDNVTAVNEPSRIACGAPDLAPARRPGLDTLAGALEDLEIPAIDDGLEAWLAFAEKLQTLIIEHRDIGYDWEFTQEQEKFLHRYLYATHFLVECLDVAYVSDRAAIEERLLRPPRNLPGLLE